MEGVLMDRAQANWRSRVSSKGAVITRPRYMSLDPNHQPLKQQQQHNSFCGSLPPNYSSAPLLQPPLLPLPPLRQRERMKPGSPAVASSVHRRKLGISSKEMVLVAAAPEAGTKRDQEEILMESPCVYSLSPPPSNLPLPSFLLTRQKTNLRGIAMESGDPQT